MRSLSLAINILTGKKGGSFEPPRTPPVYGPAQCQDFLSRGGHVQCTNLACSMKFKVQVNVVHVLISNVKTVLVV